MLKIANVNLLFFFGSCIKLLKNILFKRLIAKYVYELNHFKQNQYLLRRF